MTEAKPQSALRWLFVVVAALAVVWMLAYVRGQPGVDGRAPDPEDASAVMVVQPSETI